MNTLETPQNTNLTSSRLDALDGLRGFAALLIVVYHIYGNIGAPEWRLFGVNVLRPLHDGFMGVNLFLVISGFCLFWPYASNAQRKLNFRDFMTRRARRLIPAYYVSLIVIPLWSIIFAKFFDPTYPSSLPTGIGDVVSHLVLLHSLSSETIYSINGVAWSLGLEWTWYLFFPIAVWSFRRFGARTSLLAMCLVTVLYRVSLFLYYGPSSSYTGSDFNWAFTIRTFLAGRLFEFGIGMYVAWWVANRNTSLLWLRVCGVSFLVLLAVAHLFTPIDPFLPVRDMLYGISFALLLLVAVSPISGFIQKLFAGQLLCKVGLYSYSLYLFHMIAVTLVCHIFKANSYTGIGAFFAALFFIPIMVWLSKFCYLCFEKPFLTSPSPAIQTPIQKHSKKISSEIVQEHAAP